jgi:hypothetical protein
MKEADIFTKPCMAWFEGELVFYLVYTLSYLEGPDRRWDGEGGGGESEPTKILQDNLAYVPKQTQRASLLT